MIPNSKFPYCFTRTRYMAFCSFKKIMDIFQLISSQRKQKRKSQQRGFKLKPAIPRNLLWKRVTYSGYWMTENSKTSIEYHAWFLVVVQKFKYSPPERLTALRSCKCHTPAWTWKLYINLALFINMLDLLVLKKKKVGSPFFFINAGK